MRGILFDLDGTLLDLDLEGFLGRYFEALERAAAPLLDHAREPSSFMAARNESVKRMMEPHVGRTNQAVFYADLLERTGIDLAEHWSVFQGFYENTFPTLAGTAGPAPGARRAVTTALELGIRVAIATNPIFPRIAVDHRLSWAGLDDLGIEVVTTYEHMEACKPLPAYFRQTAALLAVEPTDCLMVGDDRVLDMAAADVGMQTFYVGPHAGVVADHAGDLNALADLLPFLA